MRKLVVCLVGMPGAGKSTIAGGLAALGYDIVNMGDAVRAEAGRRRVEPTGKNLGRIMLEMRSQNGPGAVALLVKPMVEGSSGPTVIVDGIRSSEEIEVLRRCGTLKILAVHASRNARFNFVKRRGRSDDPSDAGALEERDLREMAVGITGPIALADESISNNDTDKASLIKASLAAVQKWER